MFGMNTQSGSAGRSITYITVGVLMMIWTAVWYFGVRGEETPAWQHYAIAGLFFSGLAITVIGLLMGQIGGAARQADAPVAVAPTTGQVVAAPGAMPQAGVVMQPGVPMQQPGVPMQQPGVPMQPGVVPPQGGPGQYGS